MSRPLMGMHINHSPPPQDISGAHPDKGSIDGVPDGKIDGSIVGETVGTPVKGHIPHVFRGSKAKKASTSFLGTQKYILPLSVKMHICIKPPLAAHSTTSQPSGRIVNVGDSVGNGVGRRVGAKLGATGALVIGEGVGGGGQGPQVWFWANICCTFLISTQMSALNKQNTTDRSPGQY
mmetsp:Transcript_32167/g.47521  ORF Transcript_32167/g.47521 Transcript_32167/m.47521 type:complete len:178 (+) Transcript_32167:68-601(+)